MVEHVQRLCSVLLSYRDKKQKLKTKTISNNTVAGDHDNISYAIKMLFDESKFIGWLIALRWLL